MSLTLTVAPAVRFHLSLNVGDLARAIDFYRILFGVEPAKRRPDYAKFELEDPPLVLSLYLLVIKTASLWTFATARRHLLAFVLPM